LKFAPGLALAFADGAEQSIAIQNQCGFDVSFANSRARLGLTDFALQSPLPLDVPAHGLTELKVLFTRAQAGARDDTLFLDVTGNAQVIRYPFTLATPAQP